MSEELRNGPWLQPAENVVAWPVALAVPLGASAEGAAVWLSGFAATPDGVAFRITVAAEQTRQDLKDGLSIGVRFADGREAALDLDDRRWPPPDGRRADGIALVTQGANGSSQRWDQDAWLWPLPPAGAVTFTSSWGGEAVVDAAPLRAAADRAIELWADDRPFWPEDDEDDDDEEDEDEDGGWLRYGPADALARVAPGAVGAAPVLLHTERVAVWIGGLEATPDELRLTVHVLWRERLDDGDAEPPGRGLPFALRVEGPDGWEPELDFTGGDGTDTRMRRHGAVRPLPPAGPLRFVVSWPEAGVEEAVTELDAALVRAAAERATILWPEDAKPGA